MTEAVFVDTNVLVYNRDASEPQKQALAHNWLAHLWEHRIGRLSYQVLQEYYTTVTVKLKPGLDTKSARQDVQALLAWQPIVINSKVMEGAWNVQDSSNISWWDALIVSAAQIGNCQYLLTEDLQEGRTFDTLEIVNPFTSGLKFIEQKID
jgi:predicted nucleic acid-binding protein